MKERGLEANFKDKDISFPVMRRRGLDILVVGFVTKSMGKVGKTTLMEAFLKDNLNRVSSRVKVTSDGLMAQNMKVNFVRINCKVKAHTLGQMVELTKDHGYKGKCTARALLDGLMVVFTQVNTLMI